VKAHFKYSFIAAMAVRGPVLGFCGAIMLVFGILGAAGVLPMPAHVTGVALGGCSIAAVAIAGVISDIAVCRRMVSAPGAYLYALTPAPRWQILLTSLLTMLVLDFAGLALFITGEVWLSLNMTRERFGFEGWQLIGDGLLPTLWLFLLVVFGYLLMLLVVLFCVVAGKSVFFKKPMAGLWALLTGLGLYYILSLLPLLLAPFGAVERFGMFFIVTVGSTGLPLFTLLVALSAAALFAMTAKLMERKMNL